MDVDSVVERLRAADIQPSAQRVAVGRYVLDTHDHPCAERVWAEVRGWFPMISRATVYNTLNLFVEKGIVKELVIAEGKLVYDPKLDPHHHFIDDADGTIVDLPWNAIRVSDVENLDGIEAREWQVIVRGKRQSRQNA